MDSWNVIFLLDKTPPTKIVLLKRASTKSFAPNYYTGVGGKIEPGETPLESAYRELKEETGIDNFKLKQFAKVQIFNQNYSLYYFWGEYDQTILPKSEDGTLEWTSVKEIFKKKIIPTTRALLDEWEKRQFSTKDTFCMDLMKIDEEDEVSKVELLRVYSVRGD
jgi:8-oxo-dGTP pyrophosphatase MutT (NUDIX family)